MRMTKTARSTAMERACTAFLGAADIIHGMSYGGVRYKYNHGVFIDNAYADDTYRVNLAGRPTQHLGTRRNLVAAKRLACRKLGLLRPAR